MSTKKKRRLDKDRITLKKGESQRKDGRYSYRWTADDGTRHTVYALTLEELREKEQQIARDLSDGIRAETKNTTLNDLFELWCTLKRGLKDNTFQNYKYMYTHFVRGGLGEHRISTTLDIYADVTEDTKVKTFQELENTFKSIGICGTPI